MIRLNCFIVLFFQRCGWALAALHPNSQTLSLFHNSGVVNHTLPFIQSHVSHVRPESRPGLQLGRGEKKFGRGEASAYAHFTPNELIAYAERIRFTPDELGPGPK